jgi:hypothetical protein
MRRFLMQETRTSIRSEDRWVSDDEITLPFRIVCSRRESEDEDSDEPHAEIEAIRLTGKSLLEPRPD